MDRFRTLASEIQNSTSLPPFMRLVLWCMWGQALADTDEPIDPRELCQGFPPFVCNLAQNNLNPPSPRRPPLFPCVLGAGREIGSSGRNGYPSSACHRSSLSRPRL